jgi:Fungal Zn(2)-Cys(6) binuclear cluster domain
MLEESKSDVLILLDCCAAASSTASVDSGITEVIAACGFETWTPGVGEHSFSRSLIDELKFLSTGPLFTAAMLHNKVLSRIKYWKPRYNAGASLNPKDLWTEKRKTPVYILLASEAKQRSIEITPMRSIHSLPLASIAMPAPFPSSASSTSLPRLSLDPDSMDLDSTQSSLNSVWPDTNFKCPKVLITVALEEEQWLQTGSFVEWLKAVPALAKFAHVEGVYHSDSTLLIVSIPVAVWDLLPKTPALGFIGFVRSHNILSQDMPDLNSNIATVLIPTGDPVPEQVAGQFGELFESTSIRRSPPVEFDQGMAGEIVRSPAGSSKSSLSAPVSTIQGSFYSTFQSQTSRRTKAHVAPACVNCKKKHLRCDQNRPCLRCVQAGKEVRKDLLAQLAPC